MSAITKRSALKKFITVLKIPLDINVVSPTVTAPTLGGQRGQNRPKNDSLWFQHKCFLDSNFSGAGD